MQKGLQTYLRENRNKTLVVTVMMYIFFTTGKVAGMFVTLKHFF